jgi:cellulose synthase/poly-beta-1,6-N-acetylglucosamine synthase-like glycosyltransferase
VSDVGDTLQATDPPPGGTVTRGPVRVSVIVPVRNRVDLLAKLFAALDQQVYDDFEVVVVDDGSTDGCPDLAASTVIRGRPVRLIRQEPAGAVAARVRGVGEAGGSILAFTDSDCEPSPTWLSAAVAAIDDGAELAHGPTVPTRVVAPLERSVSEKDGGLFPTANLVLRREVFDAVGGFDHQAVSRWRFRAGDRAKGLGFGEDTLLGWKVARRGTVRYVPEAEVRHHVFPPDLHDWLSRSWQMAAFPALVREVPELAESGLIRHGVLFSHRSRVPMYVALASLATRRGGLIGLAFGWWVLHRFWRTMRYAPIPIPERFTGLPAQLLLDTVQGAALVTGSARARRLLL